jgi:hypothetical protein
MTHSSSYRRILSRMGYYNYQSSLLFRHIKQEGMWDSHLQHCRNFILKALDIYNPPVVTVLGSGWLLDLPLAEIIEKKISVRLVDIIHPPEVRQQAADIPGIELVEEDITGGLINEVWKKAGNHFFFNKLRSLSDIVIPEYNPSGDQGMVISLNIVTQLESLIISYLKKKAVIKEEELLAFRTAIQEKHIAFLKKHSSVLITDTEEIITDRSGCVSTVPDLVAKIPEGRYREEWTWDFDLTGTDYFNKKSIMNVKAVII